MNMPSPITLRPAMEADVPVLRELYRRTIQTINSRDYTPEQVAAWSGTADRTDALRRKIASQHFLVAQRDGEIVGFASIDLAEAYLDVLYVSADHQRMGLGRTLGNAMLDAAREAGLSRVEVDASITARPLFEALGFSHVADGFPEIDGVELRNFRMATDIDPGVRLMTRADLEAVEALDAAVFGGHGYGPYTWRQYFDLHASLMLVADAPTGGGLDGFVVGAIAEDGVGWILALGVSPDARGRGLATSLSRRVLLRMRAKGVAAVRLTVAPDNVAARALYARLGFDEGWTEPDYYGPGRDRIVMVRGPA